MGNNLTEKQRVVLSYIKDYMATNNRAPSIKEIQKGCNYSSYRSAFDKLISLEKKGYILRKLSKHRGISLVGNEVERSNESRTFI